MGQGAATAITAQGGRTPTGLPTRTPATSPPPPPLAKPKGPLGRKTGARGLGAAELHARGPKPKEPNPTAAPKVAEVSAMQPAVWIRRRWS